MGSKQLFLDNIQQVLNSLNDQNYLIPVEYFNFDNNDALNFKFKYKNNDTIYNVYIGLDYESIEYWIRYIDKDTIEFEYNGKINSRATSLTGLKIGLKKMIDIEKQIEVRKTIYS